MTDTVGISNFGYSPAFNKALEFTLRWEGGYVNDVNDPGGETKFGISKRAYPDEDIKNLTRERASEIYYRDYWINSGCPALNAPFSVVVFDSAVNCGIARAVLWLEDSNSPEDVIVHREAHYKALVQKKPLMSKFLKGWFNRTSALRKFISSLSP